MSPAAKTCSRPVHPPVLVDGDEAIAGLRQTIEPRATEPGQCNDAVSGETPLGNERQPAVDDFTRIGSGVNRDSALAEQSAHRPTPGVTKQLQRLLLGRHQRKLNVELVLACMGRRHQRELVDRQRPDRPIRDDECDAPHGTGVDLLQQAAHPVRIGGAAEGQRARYGDGRHGPAGDEQDVVGKISDRCMGLTALGVDTSELAQREGRAGSGSQLGQLEVARLAERERLGNRQRAVPEVRLGSEQLDRYAFLGQRP